jgi:transcriptional regulator with XRE-family HTH domain
MSSKTKKRTWESELRESQLVLSENIRKLRGQRGLSQERLALEADVDRTLVSKIERVIANPSLGILVKLAVALDVPVLHLLREQQKS